MTRIVTTCGTEPQFSLCYQLPALSFTLASYSVAAPVVRAPYVHHLSFSLEKSLPANTVVKAAYVGKLGNNLLRMNQKNPAAYIAANLLSGTPTSGGSSYRASTVISARSMATPTRLFTRCNCCSINGSATG